MNAPIHSVVLCGGSGTRLWPLSRKALPKQFAPLVNGRSLLSLTLERLKFLGGDVTCVAAEAHRFLVQEAMDECKVSGRQILEPVGRNTAAAIAVSALIADPKDLLLFAPADHHIPDAQSFLRVVMMGAAAAASGSIVTFGVVPTFPSTAYGYIELGQSIGDAEGEFEGHKVSKFVEKPDIHAAQKMMLEGRFLWNAGLVLARAEVLIKAFEEHAPDILDACKRSVNFAETDGNFLRLSPEDFANIRGESMDYAVLEKHKNMVVFPFKGVWTDVGSWNALSELYPADEAGNRLNGAAMQLNARNTFVHAPIRPVVALGTEDLIIVDTQDAVLVANVRDAEMVKDVVTMLSDDGRLEAIEHRRVARPWGAYDGIDAGERFQVKRLTVKPGAKLSLQMHYHRAEHWVVVKGTAKVTRGEETVLVRENESIYIPLGTMHRLENPGKVLLEVIEVQSGPYLGEDDIVRFDDTYGRVVK